MAQPPRRSQSSPIHGPSPLRHRHRSATKRRRNTPYSEMLSLKCWQNFTAYSEKKLEESSPYIREVRRKFRRLSLLDLEDIHEKLDLSFEVSNGFANNAIVCSTRNDLQDLRDDVWALLDSKRQVHPPPPQRPLSTSGDPGTSQMGGSGMGGSERRSGSISDPETWNQDQIYSFQGIDDYSVQRNDDYSVQGNHDPEEPEMLRDLLQRMEKLEQKNEANEQKLASYELEIVELKRKNLELEQANEDLRNDFMARIDEIENSSGSTHAGAVPPVLRLQLGKLEKDVEKLSKHYQTISKQIECEFSESFGQVDRDEGLDSLVDELKNTVDNLRNASQPQCTPWQDWKSEACKILKVHTPGDKTTERFRCFDSRCPYKNKTGITLKAYIMHLKNRKYHYFKDDISKKPELRFLPIV